MAITKQKKTEIVKKVKEILHSAKSVVFVNFHGLKVADTTQLRRRLREQGIGYTVAKKSLVGLALGGARVEGDAPALDGELALAYGSDEIAPARAVAQFAKTHKDKIKFLGGIFGGHYKSALEMQEIGSIPSLEVLRGMLVNIINSPIQGLVVVLNEYGRAKSGGTN